MDKELNKLEKEIDIDDMCDWISKKVEIGLTKFNKIRKDFNEGRIDINGVEILRKND